MIETYTIVLALVGACTVSNWIMKQLEKIVKWGMEK